MSNLPRVTLQLLTKPPQLLKAFFTYLCEPTSERSPSCPTHTGHLLFSRLCCTSTLRTCGSVIPSSGITSFATQVNSLFSGKSPQSREHHTHLDYQENLTASNSSRVSVTLFIIRLHIKYNLIEKITSMPRICLAHLVIHCLGSRHYMPVVITDITSFPSTS